MRFKTTLAAICLLAAAAAISGAYAVRQSTLFGAAKPVDPGLAGSWKAVGRLEGHEFQLLFTFNEDGGFSRRYIVDDAGMIERGRDTLNVNAGSGLTAGQWKYYLMGPHSLKLAAAGEPTLWQRVLASEHIHWTEFKIAEASNSQDPLAGTWKASFPAIGANWSWTIEIGSGGSYHSHLEADDRGLITAENGNWEMTSNRNNKTDAGIYRVQSSAALEFHIWPFGQITLNRKL